MHSTSKIEGDKITYLSVGNIPQDIYCLSIIPNDSRLSQYWPNSVEGIDPDTDGTLFYNHKGVGKKLPKNSDVVVGHKYILLTQDSSYRDQKYRNINIELICQSHVKDSFWYAYEVTAIALDDSTRRFFAKFGCYLTEDAVTFTPLWPAYIKGPSLFKHCSEEMTFFIREGAFPKIYPEELYAPLQTELCDSGKVFTINCNEGRQILSAGRTTVLLYSQIWNDPLDQTTPLPKIKVTDLDFREIPSGEHTSLPLKKTLVVTTPFDGHIVVKKHNTVIEKRLIKSNQDNQEIELDKLQHGHSVEIFQGLDLVWSASYIKTVSDSKSSDSQLLKKLEHCDKPEIDIPYSLGSIVKRMAAYPKTKLWLYKHIRNGKMSQRAYKILISYFARKQERK